MSTADNIHPLRAYQMQDLRIETFQLFAPHLAYISSRRCWDQRKYFRHGLRVSTPAGTYGPDELSAIRYSALYEALLRRFAGSCIRFITSSARLSSHSRQNQRNGLTISAIRTDVELKVTSGGSIHRRWRLGAGTPTGRRRRGQVDGSAKSKARIGDHQNGWKEQGFATAWKCGKDHPERCMILPCENIFSLQIVVCFTSACDSAANNTKSGPTKDPRYYQRFLPLPESAPLTACPYRFL